jgi:hypothetical protein
MLLYGSSYKYHLTMRGSIEALLWGIVSVVLVTFAIPWFLWGESAVVAGLPTWIWWHVGWLGLTAVVFHVFARRAWGVGVETAGGEVDG